MNGTKDNDPMVIDIDKDEPEPVSKPVEAKFENQEEEISPLEPYKKIIRYIDIIWGTEARHVSTPSIPADLSQLPLRAYPSIFSTHIVVAAACSDFSIRLVTLPLSPPPEGVNDSSKIGTDTIEIAGPYSHKDLPSSISVTHTGKNWEGEEAISSRSSSRGARDTTPAGNPWSLLIASTSPTAGGQLLIHQIPILLNSKLPVDNLVPIQKRYLNSGIGCKVVFNPAAYPDERHSNLLITYPGDSVKLYQCFQASTSRNPRGRRGSTATSDSSFSRSSRRGLNGKFLLTLRSPFYQAGQSLSRREHVLDSTWVLSGRAIITLLESGKWGIWDIEGAGPSPDSEPQNLFRGQATSSGISGSMLTNFSLTGLIQQEKEARYSSHSDAQESNSRALAPKTPNTRKIQSDALFKGQSTTPAFPDEYVHGSISVARNYDSDSSRSIAPPDESIVFTYGSQNVVIPSLTAFWRARRIESGVLNSSSASRPITLEKVRLSGGYLVDVAHFPMPSRPSHRHSVLNDTDQRVELPEILIAYGHRMVLLVQPLKESKPERSDDPQSKILTVFGNGYNEDQMLLDRGELDVEGMGRLLDGMNGSALPAASGVATSPVFGMSMGPPPTPTPDSHAGGRRARPATNPMPRTKF